MLRVMPRNRWRVVWLLAPTGELTEVVDEDGYRTGEFRQGWETPVRVKANVNPPQGLANGAPFGTATDYDLIIAIDRDECERLGVEVGWRVWLDDAPEWEWESGRPTDAAWERSFVVERVSPSPHYVQVGIRTARGE